MKKRGNNCFLRMRDKCYGYNEEIKKDVSMMWTCVNYGTVITKRAGKNKEIPCVVDSYIQHYQQISHAFLFNIRSYSPKVINIQRRKAELNIVLPRVNNLNIEQKRRGIFVLLYATNTKPRSGKIKTNKIQHISVKTSFFKKAELRHI